VPTDEGPRLALVTPLESAESPAAPAAWLAVGVPRGVLDAQLVSMREELVGLGLAAAVLVACAATLARRIAGPVTALVKVTDSVRAREFDVEVRPRGPTRSATWRRVRPDAAGLETAARRPARSCAARRSASRRASTSR
jgi:hypothetical protein